MKKYKVIAITCFVGSKQKLLNANDIVGEDLFEEDELKDLLERGFLAEVKEKPKK